MIKELAQKLAAEIEAIDGFEVVSISHSTNAVGHSSYVIWQHELIEAGGRKFCPRDEVRISDHACGIQRHVEYNHIYGESGIAPYIADMIEHVNKIKAM